MNYEENKSPRSILLYATPAKEENTVDNTPLLEGYQKTGEKRKSVKNPNLLSLKKNSKNIINYTSDSQMTRKQIIKIYMKTMYNSINPIIAMLSLFLTETFNLIFLGRLDPSLLQINACQIGIILLNSFGGDLANGGAHAFDNLGAQAYLKKDWDKLYKVIHCAKIFSLLIFVLIILPLCFVSDYILYFLGFDSEIAPLTGSFVKIALISVFFNIFITINFKLLNILGYSQYVLIINLISLGVHIICCMIFIYTFKMGVIGAGISMCASSTVSLVLSTYFIYYKNPIEGKGICFVDMSVLSSSNFYYYAVFGFYSGILYSVRHLSINLSVFGSYYLDKISLTTNTIVSNYLSLIFYILIGLCIPLSHNIHSYISKENFLKNAIYIKASLYLASILIIIISIFNYFMKHEIAKLFVNDETVIENTAWIIKLYCFFIIFDWGMNLCLAILKGVNKHIQMNLIISLLLLFVFLPLGTVLAFSYGYGYAGFWYSVFGAFVLFTFINIYYLLDLNVEKEFHRITREHAVMKEEEMIEH